MFKKAWVAALAALTIGLTGYVGDVDAKRMGGGRSLGQQNSITRQAPPQAAPGAPSAGQSAAARQQNPAAAGQAQSRSRWGGPLAGIAAGLGLAWLASSLGLGEEFATILLIMLVGMVALAAFRIFMARRAAGGSAANGGRGGFAYQGAGGRAPQATDARYQLPGSARPAAAGAAGAASGAAGSAAAGGVPGLDADQFVRVAQGQFARLQGAFDTGRIDELREFTSPQMFAELQRELTERGGRPQVTEILTLNGQFLGSERIGGAGGQELAAVRFTGMLRESSNEPAQAIDETWNFTRPVDRSSGWVLAGIQQDGSAG